LALVLEIETLTETILHAQRKERFVLGAPGGHVAGAVEMWERVLNALVEDSLKKSTERYDNTFARVESDYWVIL
jgi:hypothetical protein